MAFNKTTCNDKYHLRPLQQHQQHRRRRPRSPSPDSSLSPSEDSSSSSYSSDNSTNGSHQYRRPHYHKIPLPPHSEYLALDCEMVGTLTGKSVAAHVVVVNWNGKTIFDEYIRPTEQVTDYRTFVSGVTAEDLKKKGKPLRFIRMKIHKVLQGKILVGHALPNDLKCLGITHPWHLQRDTAYYGPFMQQGHVAGRDNSGNSIIMQPRKLRLLASERLGRQIQVPGKAHCPAEDAIAALDLYKSQRHNWELCMQRHLQESFRTQQLHQLQMQYEQQRYLQQQFFRLHQPRQECQ